MSGNTRGKLKENFEGIHRNFDWATAHVNKSLLLIADKLSFTEAMAAVKGDAEKEQAVLDATPIYMGIKALGEGIQTLDEIAQKIYSTL